MGDHHENELKILLGLTGSVASIKANEIVSQLQGMSIGRKVQVKVVATEKAMHFYPKDAPGAEVLTDSQEWIWKERGDPVLHIDLSKWADVFVIAPLDALTLSKLAHGHCDNLLTCCFMAWDFKNVDKLVVLCPSMNTKMWQNPATKTNLNRLREYPRIQVIWPISKKLMCGDTGVGAMEEPAKIAKTIESIINKKKLKYGVNFCMSMAITAGCTFGLAMIIVRSLMRSWK